MVTDVSRRLWRQVSGWHRPMVLFAGAMAVLAVVAFGGLLFDDRVLVGAPIWMKPFKFAISLTVYGLTLAWLLSLLRRTPRLARWSGNLIALAGLGEIVVIVGQVIRGRQSHFDVATPLDAAAWSLMGGMIVVLWVVNLFVGALLLREKLADRPLAAGLRFGVGMSLAGMAVAFLMTQPTPQQLAQLRNGAAATVIGAHSVGVPDGGPGLPVVGWSTVGGDLRIPHFVGLHALQALPLLAALLAVAGRRSRVLRDERTRTGLIRVAAGGYAGLLALLTWQALRGQSLVHPDGVTSGALVLLVLAVTAGVVAVLPRTRQAGPKRPPPLVYLVPRVLAVRPGRADRSAPVPPEVDTAPVPVNRPG